MSSNKSLKDRQERIPLQVLINYEIDNKKVTMFCSNLSEGGVFIETTKPSPVGTRMKLSFSLPIEKKTFTLDAKVVWVTQVRSAASECGMGCQFENVDAETQKLIDKALSYFQKMLGKKNV